MYFWAEKVSPLRGQSHLLKNFVEWRELESFREERATFKGQKRAQEWAFEKASNLKGNQRAINYIDEDEEGPYPVGSCYTFLQRPPVDLAITQLKTLVDKCAFCIAYRFSIIYIQIRFSFLLGFQRIHINAMSMTTLQLTRVPPFMTIAKTIMETFTNQQMLRIQPKSHPVVNVWSKINLLVDINKNFLPSNC